MARDFIVRTGERIATLVHDEPDLKVKTLVVASDGLYTRTDDGDFPIGTLTQALRQDLAACDHCYVVFMQDNRVMKTTEARLLKEP
jgi:hypothetical protein|nr:hypothetical protein [Neorhizobium tomejilense]